LLQVSWDYFFSHFSEKGEQKRVRSAMESGSDTDGGKTEKKDKKKKKGNYFQYQYN